MEFGTGELRGWVVTPGERESRERTARGAILKLAWLTGEGREAEAEEILRDHGERIAAAVLAEVDRLKPLVQPTPDQLAELARRGDLSAQEQAATVAAPSAPAGAAINKGGGVSRGGGSSPRGPFLLSDRARAALEEAEAHDNALEGLPLEPCEVLPAMQRELDEVFDSAPEAEAKAQPEPLGAAECTRRLRAAGFDAATVGAELGWTVGMVRAALAGQDADRLGELAAFVQKLGRKDPREERRKWLAEVSKAESPGLWVRLASQDPVTPSPGAWCSLCAQDVADDAVTERHQSVDFWAHRQCCLKAAHDAARAGRIPKPELPPPGLTSHQERLLELARVAMKSEVKPKAYRGEKRIACELCAGPIAKDAPARRKRPAGYPKPESKASSKFMHEGCVARVLANPCQPLSPEEGDHAS